MYGKFLALRSSEASCGPQSSILRLLLKREAPTRPLFARGGDRRLANATVLALVDSNKTIANEQTQVARQRRPLKALEVREPRRRNRAGLNQRRQPGELGAAN